MKTVQIIVHDGTMDTVEQKVVIEGVEQTKEVQVKHWDVVKEFEVDDDQRMQRKCRMRAEMLNRDRNLEYGVRVK